MVFVPQDAAHPTTPDCWRGEGLPCADATLPVIEFVVAAMAAEGYPRRDLFGMRLALEEALSNAVKHGHRGDPTKRISIRYRVNAQRVLAEVEDQGAGFDTQAVPDPLAPENLGRPSGRGLLLMRTYTTWVRYNERGNGVTLCKCRSDPQAPQ
jgi:serine/threonine-protein kinase RsbW